MVFEDMISVPGIPSHLNYQAGYKKGYTTGFKVRASVSRACTRLFVVSLRQARSLPSRL
jgi:hypothetical protein